MMISPSSFLLIIILLLVAASSVSSSVSSSSSSSSLSRSSGGRNSALEKKSVTTTYWEEEIPPPPSDKDTASNKKNDKNSRPLFWTREIKSSPRKRLVKTPHPMRTNKWEIRFTTRNRKLFTNRTLEMDFDDELGYCKAASNDEVLAAPVGKWHMIPSGVLWRYNNDSNESSNRLLHFTAEIHLNPFGDHPRMLRGVVVRDRSGRWLPSSWLRPVVGTFEAVGIGEDLHDTSYEDRGFSLDSTRTFLK